jgi:hypothetical protein
MKASSKMRRYGILAAAALICVLAGSVVANAFQTLTVPNAAFYTYNLAPGAYSAAITPPTNVPVLMMGTQTTVGYRGVAMATIMHIPASFMEWVGLESTTGAAITQGYSGSLGAHILYLDFSHSVDVQVASVDTIWVHNGSSITMTGTLELIW